MSVNTVQFSEAIVERFSLFFKSGRLAHAYLFVGPKKVGKSETAFEVAKLVNCEEAKNAMPCDECSSCVKINNGQHPDVHAFGFDGEPIKIQNVRQMLSRVQLRAFEAKTKVFIIKDSENLTLEASNALLKTLEEPTSNSLILLTTSVLERVLSTVKSRCQLMSFFPLGPKELKKSLIKEHKQGDEISHFLAYSSEGCLGKISEQDFKDIFIRKNRVIDEFVFAPDAEEYIKEIVRDKAEAKEALWFLFCWFKDLALIKLDVPKEKLIHFDRSEDLGAIKEKYSFDDVEKILTDITTATRAVQDNFNVKIPLTLIKEKAWKK
ncbi:MAG: DNA polymerase III subunit [Candidatus Aceula meridiana]|nr:DNA polymerase III subunit [Candidatus Aceula meridiana]